jgi:hypothetical protein
MTKKQGTSAILGVLLAFAAHTASAFPIDLKVANDKDGKIYGAFAKILYDLDIQIGGNNTRYVLDVNVTLTPLEISVGSNKFAVINVVANLTDTEENIVLLPFNFSMREGHYTAELAEQRCFTYAEKRINDDYRMLLSDYLSKMEQDE